MPTYNVYIEIRREGWIEDIQADSEEDAIDQVSDMSDEDIIAVFVEESQEIDVNSAEYNSGDDEEDA